MNINQRPKINPHANDGSSFRTMHSDLTTNFSSHTTEPQSFSEDSFATRGHSNNQDQSFAFEEKPNSLPSPFLENDSLNQPPTPPNNPPSSSEKHISQQPIYPTASVIPTIQPSVNNADSSSKNNPPNSSINPISFFQVHQRTILFSGLLILIIGLLGLGGYYYWTRISESKETMEEYSLLPLEELPPSPSPVMPTYYSKEQPNYLSVDIETINPADLNRIFLETSTKIFQDPINLRSTEFIITDKNNNPLAFSRFAIISKLSLPPEVLENLEENFSIFIMHQPQSNRPRIGIAIALKNREALISSIRLREPQLAVDFNSLFLETTPASLVGEFRDGVYQGIPIRYLNLNQQEDLSIDYTVSASNLLIGTSKELLRSIIDLDR